MSSQNPDYSLLPEHTAGAMRRYLEDGLQPGGFLTACLENNLTQAFSRADHINSRCMKEIAQFLVWEIPSNAWGSPEKVNQWIAAKRQKEVEAK